MSCVAHIDSCCLTEPDGIFLHVILPRIHFMLQNIWDLTDGNALPVEQTRQISWCHGSMLHLTVAAEHSVTPPFSMHIIAGRSRLENYARLQNQRIASSLANTRISERLVMSNDINSAAQASTSSVPETSSRSLQEAT
jgi:hypothetical protein